jgi:hypothetical protein
MRRAVEVHRSLPPIFGSIDVKLIHRLLIIPDYVDFCDYWTVHGGVSDKVFQELGVVATSGVSDCHQAEAKDENRVYVFGG